MIERALSGARHTHTGTLPMFKLCTMHLHAVGRILLCWRAFYFLPMTNASQSRTHVRSLHLRTWLVPRGRYKCLHNQANMAPLITDFQQETHDMFITVTFAPPSPQYPPPPPWCEHINLIAKHSKGATPSKPSRFDPAAAKVITPPMSGPRSCRI